MIPRHQLPVWSPVNTQALWTGLSGYRNRVKVAELIREHWGTKEVVLTDSGTSALRLALEAARPPSAELVVALPGWGCYDLATAAIGARARVELYDLDPATLGPDLEGVEKLLRKGVQVLVVVHPYGLPVAMREIGAMARRYGAVLVEDAAQGAGGALDGRPLGGHGSLAVLSFGRGKGITGGGGGALLANDPDGVGLLALDRISRLRGVGLGRRLREPVALGVQWLLGRPEFYTLPASLPFLRLGETVYRPPRDPRRMTSFAAGVLRRTLPLQEAEAIRRRRHAAGLEAALVSHGGVPIRVIPGGEPGYLRYPVILPQEVMPVRRLGVETGYPVPLTELSPLRTALCSPGRLPGAEAVARRLVTLPTHGRVAADDLAQLETWLASCFSAWGSGRQMQPMEFGPQAGRQG